MVDLRRFTDYRFAATGAPTKRTMPDRLAEVRNVLEFGADNTANTDSTAAVQRAVDRAVADGGGTIYFPIGNYHITSAVLLNSVAANLRFRGEGGGSSISALPSFNGFVFDRHPGSPNNDAIISFEGLNIQNGNTGTSSGAIRCGSSKKLSFRDLSLSGFTCISTEDSPGVGSQSAFFENIKFQGPALTNSVGLVHGGSGVLAGSDFIGSDVAVLVYGNGLQMAGNRIERCNTAYQLGCDSAGTDRGMSGFSLNGSTEGNSTNIWLKGLCKGGFVGPVGMLGHDSSNSGMTNGVENSQYGLRIDADKAQGCVFLELVPNSWFDVAGISIANASARANNVFFGCLPTIGAGTGVPWIFPTNAFTARFLQNNSQPVWTYSQLPTGGNVLEGDEFDISDGTNGLNWGDPVTNTGTHTTHYRVRYNGTIYTVLGK